MGTELYSCLFVNFHWIVFSLNLFFFFLRNIFSLGWICWMPFRGCCIKIIHSRRSRWSIRTRHLNTDHCVRVSCVLLYRTSSILLTAAAVRVVSIVLPYNVTGGKCKLHILDFCFWWTRPPTSNENKTTTKNVKLCLKAATFFLPGCLITFYWQSQSKKSKRKGLVFFFV